MDICNGILILNKQKFDGFPPSTLEFLRELAVNNNRPWFQENKGRYESEVLAPALDFITAMAPEIQKISPHYLAVAKRTGGSLMRVYRDARFSKDKSPYKTNIGIQFRHFAGKDVHAPGIYFHVEPEEFFFGVGSWRPDSKALGRIRESISDSPNHWKKLIHKKKFKESYELVGDKLKRPPKGFNPEHPLIEDLKRKDFLALRNFDESLLYSKDLVPEVSKQFKAGKEFLEFLCESLELPF